MKLPDNIEIRIFVFIHCRMCQLNLGLKNFPVQFAPKCQREKKQFKNIFSLTQERDLLTVLTALRPFHKVATCIDILEKVMNK